jgi:hypothetical protein
MSVMHAINNLWLPDSVWGVAEELLQFVDLASIAAPATWPARGLSLKSEPPGLRAKHLGDFRLLHRQVDGLSGLTHVKLNSRSQLHHTGQPLGPLPDALWSLPFDHMGNLQP